jgi:carbon storage regulator
VLVITRKENESFVVGDATVTIVAVGKGRVRVGIDAPQSVEILRSEILGKALRGANASREATPAEAAA